MSSSDKPVRRWTEKELIERYGKLASYYVDHSFIPEDSDGFLDAACAHCGASADIHPKERLNDR